MTDNETPRADGLGAFEERAPDLAALYQALDTLECALSTTMRSAATSEELLDRLKEASARAAARAAEPEAPEQPAAAAEGPAAPPRDAAAAAAPSAAAASAPPPETAGAELEALRARVLSCAACGLAAGRQRAVFGQGVSRPVVLVVGEGPGAEEDRQGLPFVGASGQLLDKMLASIGLSRGANCYIANIVKCRPPNNREPAPGERAACLPYLKEQIRLLAPRAILCAGRTAAQTLLGTTEGINRLRTRAHALEGIPLVATFHPSALLRDETLKRPAWEDLKRLRDLLAAGAGAAGAGTAEEKGAAAGTRPAPEAGAPADA
ncbi:uracil-DNA glycosylase [bacterium]|nr:uracil-DNA glycosylase [bacterium]